MIEFKSECSVDLVQHCGGDHMVVAAAKVCVSGCSALSFKDGTAKNDKGEPWSDKDTFGLINYLMKHRHGTPFEHGSMTFYVHAPLFVWREWHRHRIGFSYNEESARYKQLDPGFYVPPRDRPMMKVDGWKPGRPKFTVCDDEQKYSRIVDRL
jgi:thymidylate synthase (FAD)